MSTIDRWLEEAGLAAYAKVFADNGIDVDVLEHLSEDDLKELGLNLGDRRRFQAGLRSTPESEISASPRSDTREAEHRQLTVMFCDLVGSVELGEQMDVEDYRDLLARFRTAMTAAVERSDGFVARHQGDGLLAYFGYPQAHESDAERAVRAGLDVVAAVESLEHPYAITATVRVGIATGTAVVGDLLETGGSPELAALGRTPNLAARLQGQAAPNSVVISETTRALTSGLFDLEALPAIALKGISTAVAAYQVRAEVRGQSRFAARAGTRLSRFVGREEELELLSRRWAKAKAGQGQVVLTVGEAGLGKSRLVQQLRERIGTERHQTIYLQCSPHHEGSALYPVITAFEAALGFAEIHTAQGRLDALRQHLQTVGDIEAETLELLAYFLSATPQRAFPDIEAMHPAQRRERTLRAMVRYIRKRASKATLLIAFEDMHWADPTTRELLGRLVEGLGDEPVLLIVTTRPGFEAQWTDLPHAHVLTLSRLESEAGEKLAQAVASAMIELPPELVRTIVTRAGGNPLFIEELTRTMVRAQSDPQPDPVAVVPATLQDSLMARLDSLSDGKAVAQTASVIGGEFEFALLAEIWEGARSELDAGLSELVKDGLLHRRGEDGEARYRFRHALIQDTAYAALLRDTRRKLHERTVEALRRRKAPPELLAHHFMQAELSADAVEQWQLAGREALAGSAHEEAVGHLTHALRALEHLPPGEDRDRAELGVRIELGRTLAATRGYGAPEVRDAYERAAALSQSMGNVAQQFYVARGLGAHHGARTEYEDAKTYGEQCLRLAEQEEREPWLIRAHLLLGTIQTWTGAVTQAHESLTLAARLAKTQERDRRLTGRTEDPEVLAIAIDSMALGLMGRVSQARSAVDAANALADSLSHPLSRAAANGMAAFHFTISKQYESVGAPATRALETSTEHRLSLWRWNAMIFRGCASVHIRGDPGGLGEARDGIDMCRTSGSRYMLPIYLTLLAEALAACGQSEEGLRAVAEGVEIARRTGEFFYLPEAMRVQAELRLLCGHVRAPEAVSQLMESLSIAHEHGLHLLELQTAVSIARLQLDQERPSEATAVLAPIYERFTEGHDTPILREAAALLSDLS